MTNAIKKIDNFLEDRRKEYARDEACSELASLYNLVLQSTPTDGVMLKYVLSAGIRGVEALIPETELDEYDQERLGNLKELYKRLSIGRYDILGLTVLNDLFSGQLN